MKAPTLRKMSADQLIELRDNIDKLLSTKITAARHELQVRLAKLEQYAGGSVSRGRKRGRRSHPSKGSKLPPKFRGPGGETWAGRGAQPRWLSEVLKQGRKIEEFAVSKIAGARRKTPGKSRRAAK
jgi:DNA-binding protein H-NS